MENPVIEKFEAYNYQPPTSIKINESNNDIPINVFNEDIFTYPHKSLLVIAGNVIVKKTQAIAGEAGRQSHVTSTLDEIDLTKINITNNGFLHFFDRIEYFLGDTKVDSIRRPGISTTIKGLACLDDDRKYNAAGWKIINKAEVNLDKNGYFQAFIPLNLVMGFFEDCTKIINKMPQKLILYRAANAESNVINFDDNTLEQYACSFNLTEIIWQLPQIKFSLEYETKIKKEILKDTNYELTFRQWLYNSTHLLEGTEYSWDIPTAYSKTKYILVGFQLNRENNYHADISKFDFLNLENCQVLLNNNTYYPQERMKLYKGHNKCGTLYHMFKEFKTSYYSDIDKDSQPLVDYKTFIEKFPIICIDCSYQPSIIKDSQVSIKIVFSWRDPVPAGCIAHCLMIYEKQIIYNPLNNRVVNS